MHRRDTGHVCLVRSSWEEGPAAVEGACVCCPGPWCRCCAEALVFSWPVSPGRFWGGVGSETPRPTPNGPFHITAYSLAILCLYPWTQPYLGCNWVPWWAPDHRLTEARLGELKAAHQTFFPYKRLRGGGWGGLAAPPLSFCAANLISVSMSLPFRDIP